VIEQWHRYLITIGSATQVHDVFVIELSPSQAYVYLGGQHGWIAGERIGVVEELPLTRGQNEQFTQAQAAARAAMESSVVSTQAGAPDPDKVF
jgi:hypothetical protein